MTRHAIAYGGQTPSRDWVHSRRERLVQLAACSLGHQTIQSFEWLVFVDPVYAAGESDYLKQSLDPRLNFRVVPASYEDLQQGPTFWRESLGDLPEGCPVLTTRLDSDDALHPSFLERARRLSFDLEPPAVLDLVEGVFVDSAVGIPLARPYRGSPFQSLLELPTQASPIVTVMSHPHPDLPNRFAYHPIATPEPMWFVSVHGGNLGNRAFGAPRTADVVPRHLQRALGVRPSGYLARWSYATRIGITYGRRFADPSRAWPALRVLAGHLGVRHRGRSSKQMSAPERRRKS